MTENTTLQSIKSWFRRENTHSISDADAFTRLYEETHLIVFRYIYGLSGGPQQEAEDLTAETYVRAWKTRQRFTGDEGAALGWLLQIARNLAIDLSRRRKVRATDENIPIEFIADSALSLEIDLIAREQIAILWQLLGALTDNIREMLVLRYILGWQVKEIADHLGMKENNVSVVIRRSLQSLQRKWPQEKDHG